MMDVMTKSNRKNHKLRTMVPGGILILVILYVILCLYLPIKALSVGKGLSTLNITTQPSNLPWPSSGEAAVGLSNGTVIQSHGAQKPVPTASVAKLITALAVLKKYPLSVGQSGPLITIDATDYGFYTKYIAEQGSVVPVYSGEQLTEYQMLEAMLVPSGNNIADALARWAYGSVSAYDSYASTFVKQLGLDQTHIGSDASGYLPNTTSTADNLIKLGSYILANPVLASIVNMKTINVPNVGVMTNYDNILGTDGIIGIKTGNSNQAGGVFLGAANTIVNGKRVTILTAIMGAASLVRALNDTVPLVVSLENDFAQTILVSKGEVVGEFKQPWGGNIQIVASQNLIIYVLQGQTAKAQLKISNLSVPSAANTSIGTITAIANQFNPNVSVPLKTLQNTSKPSWSWRLTHPGYIL